jgi:hypothetical protein
MHSAKRARTALKATAVAIFVTTMRMTGLFTGMVAVMMT